MLVKPLSILDISYNALGKYRIAIMPVGSVEQHCKAPLGTDYIIADYLSRETCNKLNINKIKCIIIPGLPYGFSPEWSSCPGTITLSSSTFRMLLWDILNSLDKTPLEYLAIINGHGGNSTLLESTIREWIAQSKHKLDIIIIDYWKVANITLGHCDKLEEILISYIIDKQIKCNCNNKIIINKKKTKRIVIPEKPCDYGLEFKNYNTNTNDLIFKIIDNIYKNILLNINNKYELEL